jgi:hypothetical protein
MFLAPLLIAVCTDIPNEQAESKNKKKTTKITRLEIFQFLDTKIESIPKSNASCYLISKATPRDETFNTNSAGYTENIHFICKIESKHSFLVIS